MARMCSICHHPRHGEIGASLLDRHLSFRRIASQFGVDGASLRRHAVGHLAATVRETHMLDLQRIGEPFAEPDAPAPTTAPASSRRPRIKAMLTALAVTTTMVGALPRKVRMNMPASAGVGCAG